MYHETIPYIYHILSSDHFPLFGSGSTFHQRMVAVARRILLRCHNASHRLHNRIFTLALWACHCIGYDEIANVLHLVLNSNRIYIIACRSQSYTK